MPLRRWIPLLALLVAATACSPDETSTADRAGDAPPSTSPTSSALPTGAPAADGGDTPCPFAEEVITRVLGPIEEWEPEQDGCNVTGEHGRVATRLIQASLEAVRATNLEGIPARPGEPLTLYDVSVCEHCTVVDIPSLYAEVAVRLQDQNWILTVGASPDGDNITLTLELLEELFGTTASLTEASLGSAAGCGDAAVRAADIWAAWDDMFAGYDTLADAPGFEEISRPVIDDLVDECGTEFAHEVISQLNVVGETAQLLTSWINA